MRRHAVVAAAVFMCAAGGGLGGAVYAHGPAPVALSILAVEEGAPSLVHTNIGLAVADGAGSYRYVCPSRWDGNERALATVSRGGTVLVQSLGLVYLSQDDACTFSPVDLGEDYVIAVAPFGEGFAALVEDEERLRRLVALDPLGAPQEMALPLPGPPDGLFADGDALWLAGAGPPGFVARVSDGGVEVRFEGAFPEASRAVVVSTDEAGAWVQLAGASLALVRVEDGVLGAPRPFARSCHGPIRVGDATWAMFDGELHAYDGQWRSLGERNWTCLEQRDGLSLACSLEGTSSLSPAAPTPFFSMRQIGPPQACGEAEQQTECGREWAHFGGESGWLDTDPATDPVSDRRPMGCAVGVSSPARAPTGVFVVCVASLLWRRRFA